VTSKLDDLIRDLVLEEPTWATEALLGCLQTVQQGSYDYMRLVDIRDAWAGPGDIINIVYSPPWSEEFVGIRRDRHGAGALVFDIDAASLKGSEFGESVARYDLAEPFPNAPESTWHDSAGLLWWGDGFP